MLRHCIWLSVKKDAELKGDESSVDQIVQSGTKKATRHEITIVGVVVAGAFLALLNQTIMSPALPGLMQAFSIGAGDAQWVTSIYLLVNGIMVPISGFLIDKFSTRKLFFASLVAFILGSLLCALAPNFGVLIVGRILQAAGAGVQLPLVAVVPMLVFPPEKRGTAMGMAGIVMSAGPAVGPVVAGALIDALGWRSLFWGIIPIALIILIASWFLLANVGELKHPSLDIPSVLISTIAFGGLLYGFSSASTLGWANGLVIGSIIVGLVALVLFIRRQNRLKEPLLRIETLKTTKFRFAALLVTLINAASAATIVTLPIYLQTALGVDALATGMVMMPAAAIGIVLSPLSGIIFDRFGPRVISIAGLVIMVGGLLGLSQVSVSTPLVLVAVLTASQSGGMALANMPINTWGINSLSNDMIAQGNAVANTGRQVAGAIATALVVTVMTTVTASSIAKGASEPLSTAQGVGVAYAVCAGIAAVALVVCCIAMFTHKKAGANTPNDTRKPAVAPATPAVHTSASRAKDGLDARKNMQ